MEAYDSAERHREAAASRSACCAVWYGGEILTIIHEQVALCHPAGSAFDPEIVIQTTIVLLRPHRVRARSGSYG